MIPVFSSLLPVLAWFVCVGVTVRLVHRGDAAG